MSGGIPGTFSAAVVLGDREHLRKYRAHMGEQMRQAREAAGLGVRELARRLDMVPGRISNLERGKCWIQADADRVAAALDELRESDHD